MLEEENKALQELAHGKAVTLAEAKSALATLKVRHATLSFHDIESTKFFAAVCSHSASVLTMLLKSFARGSSRNGQTMT